VKTGARRRAAAPAKHRMGRDRSGPPPPGGALAYLLAPVEPQRFVREYWGKKPCYVKGWRGKYRGLFDRRRFYAAIRRADRARGPSVIHLGAFLRTDPSSPFALTSMSQQQIRAGDVRRLLARGTTVCVTHIEAVDERLATFCDAVRREMAYLGDVRFNCYFSPDRSGADVHFDARVSTTLQLEGRKLWRFSTEPAVAWPLSNAQVGRDGEVVWAVPGIGDERWARIQPADETRFREVILEPGDLLSLPAGVWHSARAIGSSLALNLSFGPARFTPYLAALLDPLFSGNPAWRGGPPPALARKLAPGETPPHVLGYLEDRLKELRAFVEAFDPTDKVVGDTWGEIVRQM
jgi:ribosomal protein L16 Arg81 hydroxylase